MPKIQTVSGLAEIRYIEGLYTMWDDIRKAFPRLFIDDCASGGRRIDLETSSRSISLWRTDGTIEPLIKIRLQPGCPAEPGDDCRVEPVCPIQYKRGDGGNALLVS